jgi:nitrogen fixation/metabolism regulation signal transduction histidine kinase
VSSLATIVETKDLVQTVVFATVAGIGVTAIFSVAIWGAARFTDLSQEERRLEAGFAAAAAGVALLAVLAAVVIGVVVMTSK